MKYPKISILVPAYNEEVVIGGTLDHLINEVKYPNKEIIVGVDGATDKTLEIAQKYAKKHKEVRIIDNKKRKGLIGIMNDMLREATGEIILKNDADVRRHYPKRCLFEIAKILEDREVGGITCLTEGFSKTGEKNKSWICRGEFFIHELVSDFSKQFYPIRYKTKHPVSVTAFRKGIIKKIGDPKGAIADDKEFGYKVLKSGYRIEWSPYTSTYLIGGPTTAHDLFIQKRRGTIGWLKISEKFGTNVNSYYFDVLIFFFKNIHKYDAKDIVAFFYWCIVFSFARISARFHMKDEPTKIWIPFKRKI